jgi:hypothetical protein
MRIPHTTKLAALFFVLSIFAGSSHAQSPVELRQDLARLLLWLPGQYDNEPQVFLEQGLGTDADHSHPRRHSLIAAIEAPELGEHVLYWQERAGGKTGAVIRQRLLVINGDEETLSLQMTMHPLTDAKGYIDLQDQPPAVQASVQIEQSTINQCPLLWKREIDQLRGQNDASCLDKQWGARQSAMAGTTWSLSKDELWILEQDGSPRQSVEHAGDFSLRYFKTRNFECYLAIELGDDQRLVENPFFLHDRGDQAVFPTGASEPAQARVVLRRSMWPSRSGRNFVELLRVVLFFDDSDIPAGMGWATPESGRVGFGTERAQARCKLVTSN